ncbi:haloacetate dehalogenase [Bradyrhizobium sp. USDA 4341]
MLVGFEPRFVETADVSIHVEMAGRGAPVLLLHGYPQTKAMWRKIAPRLAEKFTVIATDLRGYGRSSKPPGGKGHANYSKRVMAADQVEVMRQLGFTSFQVVGHDRGARVAHRMALDHPDLVQRLAVLDIAPTDLMYRLSNQRFATAYYHWYFLIQPRGFPEKLIGSDPEFFLRHTLNSWSRIPNAFGEEAIEHYARYFSDADVIRASCEDYRASATIDLDHAVQDGDRKLQQPLLAVWGANGAVGTIFDVLSAWREKATEVEGHGLPCGHFPAEEMPEETLALLLKFLK